MAKQAAIISFSSLANQTSFINGVNANFAALNAALLNTLSLDGSTPNRMISNLDMNSNQILNLPKPSFPNDPIRLQDIASTATMNVIANSVPVSSFMATVLPETTAALVRGTLGVESSLTDSGVSVQGNFWPLIPNLSDTTTKNTNTTNLQAAIDYAFAHNLVVVNISNGVFWFNPGIYLDPPGNLRTSLSSPTNIHFSMHLRGAGGSFNAEGYGTQMHFSDVTTVALIVGTGQGMRVSDLSIIGQQSISSYAAFPANGIGIGLAGTTNGGLSRCLLDNVGVWGFRKGIVTGFQANGLCDSVTLFKCAVIGCYIGVHWMQNQNYVPMIMGCEIGPCTIGVLSDVAKPINIIGGNYSNSFGKHASFSINTVSGLSSFTDSAQPAPFAFTNYSFTCVISSPDQPLQDGAYDAFVINTTAFGAIPLRLLNWNSGTNTATLCFYSLFAFNLSSSSLAATAISTATTLYACETLTTFRGVNLNIDGVHLENDIAYTCFLDVFSGFGGDDATCVKKVLFNYDISQVANHNPTHDAVFYCQQAFPFIWLRTYSNNQNGTVEISNIGSSQTSDKVNIDSPLGANTIKLDFRNCDMTPNLRTPTFTGGDPTVYITEAQPRGFGTFDETPFYPSSGFSTLGGKTYYSKGSFNHVPFEGFYPAESSTIALRLHELNLVNGSLGSIGTYPPIMGHRPYRINYYDGYDAVYGANASRWAESDHQMWSYGQDMTNTWSFVAGTNVVKLNDMTRVFSGLRIHFNEGGQSATDKYVVTGIYPTLGYITVALNRAGTGANVLQGTSGTTYTGSFVRQEPFSWFYSGMLPSTKTVVNSNAGAQTAAVGDLTGANTVSLKLTAIAANNFTTRTATQMFGDIPGAYVGLTYNLQIENTNAGTTTLVAGTGVTTTGTMTIAQNTTRTFTVTFPSSTTCTIESRGLLTSV